MGLEEEPRELSFPHGQQTQLQPSQSHICVDDTVILSLKEYKKSSVQTVETIYHLSPASSSVGASSEW